MCLSPFSIPNPNFGMTGKYYLLKDTTSQFINIPCGHCKQCIAHKQMELVQRVQMETFSNWVFFSTMTYNNDSLPIHVTSSGFPIRYADIADFQNMVYRIKTNKLLSRPFRWFAVSERGSKRARPHFHCLWLLPRYEGDDYLTCMNLENELFHVVLNEWRRNYGSRRKPDYLPLCTYIRKIINGEVKTTFDLHFVNPSYTSHGYSDVAFYVLKYMLKSSKYEDRLHSALMLNYPFEEAIMTWNLVKSRSMVSKFFGAPNDPQVISHLRNGIVRSFGISKYPLYFNYETGQQFPLADYYKRFGHIYKYEDALQFVNADYINNDIDERSLQAISEFYEKDKVQKLAFSHGDALYFDELLADS